MRRLLFLNGIKAFEAAARSGSFAGAGAELNVSAAAISRMVHLLEQRLGVALFERKANRLAMTAAGRAYQSGLTPIFDALASLTAQVTAPSGVRVLTIGVGPTFAMRWFIPRLAAQLKRASALRGPSLLRVAHASEDWPLWLKAAGVARVTARGPEFQYYGQALQAAADGLGVAMGIRPYIDDDLAAGRLVAPFALTVPKGMRWYLVYRSFQTGQRDFAAFRRWIIHAAAGPAARGKLIGRAQRHAG